MVYRLFLTLKHRTSLARDIYKTSVLWTAWEKPGLAVAGKEPGVTSSGREETGSAVWDAVPVASLLSKWARPFFFSF